jgi:hypothetical protein
MRRSEQAPYAPAGCAAASRRAEWHPPDGVALLGRRRCVTSPELSPIPAKPENPIAGRPDAPTYPYEAPPSSIASGRQAGAELLAEREWPSAILAVSDALALGVLEAAAARRLRVPEQLSVVGFDDIPAALAAGLTTIRQPAQGTAASPLACSPTPRAPNPARTCCPPS